MNYEVLFSAVGGLAMAGWLTLLISPLMPVWSNRIAGVAIPLVLSISYGILIVFFPPQGEGGFGSFSEVTSLFSQEEAVMAGWVHFLAFDLMVGAWICRTARRDALKFWLVIPCLPLTFLFGPAGLLAFHILRMGTKLMGVKNQQT